MLLMRKTRLLLKPKTRLQMNDSCEREMELVTTVAAMGSHAGDRFAGIDRRRERHGQARMRTGTNA
jgi:hypothetical protein